MQTPKLTTSLPRSRAGLLRAGVLVLLLAALGGGGLYQHFRVRHHEALLHDLGREIVAEGNREDPRPMPAEGPEADVAIETTCSWEYLFWGEPTGKVRLVVTPHAHAPVQEPFAICYIYAMEDGQWHNTESYLEH
jgi:hypothetical protein